MESLTKEYASPVCVCMQLRKAGRVVTQIYDRCLPWASGEHSLRC